MIDLAHHGDQDAAAGCVNLAVNVNAAGPPSWLRERIAAADLTEYPDQRAARAAVAARHGRRPEEVLLTAGAAEAFVLIARTLRPADAVVVHPQFAVPEQAMLAAGHPVRRVILPWPFALPPDIPEADLVFVGNPTNPTSVGHSRADLLALRSPGRTVVVDEAFADCVPGEPDSLAALKDLTGLIVVRSLTKTWGLAGLRIGYLLAEADLVAALAQAQPPWPVSAPALVAAQACSESAAMGHTNDFAENLLRDRQFLLSRLVGITVVADPVGSFVLLDSGIPDIRARLLDAGFAVRRGETFPGLDSGWIRVAVRDRNTSAAFADALHRVRAQRT